MRPSDAIKDKHAIIRLIVDKHGFSNPKIYGSVVRGEDHEGSDLDVLVERGAGRCTLITIGRLCEELSEVLGVAVDVKT
ncbi:nucleotidyltransferase family protein, partial [Pseudomonas sp. KCJK9000]